MNKRIYFSHLWTICMINGEILWRESIKAIWKTLMYISPASLIIHATSKTRIFEEEPKRVKYICEMKNIFPCKPMEINCELDFCSSVRLSSERMKNWVEINEKWIRFFELLESFRAIEADKGFTNGFVLKSFFKRKIHQKNEK